MTLKVLTVCLGNICRSPAAQGILQAKANELGMNMIVDSAGTAAYHVGNPPDARSIAELAHRSVDISKQRARQVSVSDFDEFDYILAMDHANVANLKKLCPLALQHKIHLFGQYSTSQKSESLAEVDDPYYGDKNGFVIMADHLESLADNFLQQIK